MSKVLMKGNEAIGEAAIRAGCLNYFAYPITPQSEVAEYLSRRMPEVGATILRVGGRGKDTAEGSGRQGVGGLDLFGGPESHEPVGSRFSSSVSEVECAD